MRAREQSGIETFTDRSRSLSFFLTNRKKKKNTKLSIKFISLLKLFSVSFSLNNNNKQEPTNKNKKETGKLDQRPTQIKQAQEVK